MKITNPDKKKKLILGAGVLAVFVAASVLLLGGNTSSQQPKMMSAKEAIAKAKAEVAHRQAHDSHTAPQLAAQSVPPAASSSAHAASDVHVTPRSATVAHNAPAASASAVSPAHATSTRIAQATAPNTSATAKVAPAKVAPAKADPVSATEPPPAAPVHVAAPAAHAQTTVASVAPPDAHTTGSSIYYQRVSALSDRLRLLKIQAEIDKLQGAPAKASHHSEPKASPVTVMPSAMTPAPSTDGKRMSFSLPSHSSSRDSGTHLVSVMGVGNRYQAVIQVRGAALAVHEGSRLSSGWLVSAIEPGSVRLTRGKHHKTLHMGD